MKVEKFVEFMFEVWGSLERVGNKIENIESQKWIENEKVAKEGIQEAKISGKNLKGSKEKFEEEPVKDEAAICLKDGD